jgi:hypothetical protein
VAIVLASALAHKALYTKLSTPPPNHWTHSTAATAAHILTPLITASTLTAAAIWAAAAAILPLIRADRPGAVALAGLVGWAIVTAVATTIAVPAILPGMAALGATAAVVFTIAPDVTRRLRQPTQGGDLRSMDLR